MTREKNICNKDIIEFFDKYASGWDEHMIRNEEVIKEILLQKKPLFCIYIFFLLKMEFLFFVLFLH